MAIDEEDLASVTGMPEDLIHQHLAEITSDSYGLLKQDGTAGYRAVPRLTDFLAGGGYGTEAIAYAQQETALQQQQALET